MGSREISSARVGVDALLVVIQLMMSVSRAVICLFMLAVAPSSSLGSTRSPCSAKFPEHSEIRAAALTH
jgi:hypothetical protein